jgi:formiminotetrahydrofolate cyclodeaminase
MVEEALLEASVVPIELAEIGAEVCAIAAGIAEEGNRNLIGDAITAALLAEAAVRAAAALVATNLKDSSDDEMEDRAARAMARAALSTTRAQGANNS